MRKRAAFPLTPRPVSSQLSDQRPRGTVTWWSRAFLACLPGRRVVRSTAVRATHAARGAALAIGLALIAFAVWAYAMPPIADSLVGIDSLAAAQFRGVFGVRWTTTEGTFRFGLATILALASASYLALLAALVAGGQLPPRTVGAASAAAALAFALFVPPILSADVYSYVGYARLALVHHLDPYLATQVDLLRRDDPIGPFLRGSISSPYGPLWTLISMATTAPLVRAPPWCQVVAMKLVAAAGVLALAAGGRRLADRLSPGQGSTAFAALALNPFFLIEGPGNGHNDVIVAACVAWAFVAVADRRWPRAFALVGCAGAIKFLPLLLAPWFVWRAWRDPAARGRGAVYWAGAVALVVAPLVIGYLPFWHGMATLAGLRQQWTVGRGVGGPIGPMLGLVIGLIVAYGLASRWAARDLSGLVSAWTAISGLGLVALAGTWFPWYWIWPWSAALTRWDRRGRLAALFLFCLVAGFTVLYAAAAPRPTMSWSPSAASRVHVPQKVW
jgi:hypothetical protein